jgi:uncharacterized protein YcbX
VPTVERLSVTPVKGLGLHHPDDVMLDRHGVTGNRLFFLVDRTGRLYSVPDHGPLVRVTAVFAKRENVLELRFPDGGVVAAEVELASAATTDFYGRPVAGRHVVGPFAAALSELAGKELELVRAAEEGSASDVHTITLVSAESVAELARHAGREAVDARRFRMLLELRGCTEPHEEDAWAGQSVRTGGAVLRVLGPVPRCVATTRDPDTGIRDLDTLRVIKDYRGLRDGKHVDFGMYAEVVEPGRVSLGDAIEPL